MSPRRVAVVALAGLALAGCSAKPDTSTPEGAFVAQVREAGFPGRFSDDEIVKLGQAVCRDLATGAIPGDLVTQVRAVAGEAASVVVGAAEIRLCPEVSR